MNVRSETLPGEFLTRKCKLSCKKGYFQWSWFTQKTTWKMMKITRINNIQKWLSKHQKGFNWKANALLLPAVVVSTWGVLENGGIGFSRSAELVTVEKCKYPWDRCILMHSKGGKNQKDCFSLFCKMPTPLQQSFINFQLKKKVTKVQSFEDVTCTY